MSTREAGPNPELAEMTRRFWIGLALAAPVFVLEMGGHLFAAVHHLVSPGASAWIRARAGDARRCFGRVGRSSCAAGARSSRATSTCSR